MECLTVVDEYTRECLAIDVVGSIRSNRLIDVLSRVMSERGCPQVLRSNNGPEFVSRAILRWALRRGLDTAPIDPGKPWQNGNNERFNGKFRDHCLNQHWFSSLLDARGAIDAWWKHYNEVRPHRSLNRRRSAESFPIRT